MNILKSIFMLPGGAQSHDYWYEKVTVSVSDDAHP
jgi:hypothetical protein